MIIDCHCHAGPGDGFTGPWDTNAPLTTYLARAREAGIARTVVFPPFHSDYEVANRELAKIVAGNPARLIGFAMVHPRRDQGRVYGMVEKAVRRYGFRGLKVHQHDGRITREICEAARAFGVPILYDVMGEIVTVDVVAREFPDVDFIIPHLGSFGDDYRAQVGLIDVLVRFPNVHTDTAGVRRFDLLAEAIRRAGPDKVLFGSDGPFLHPGVELAKIPALALGPAAEHKVLAGNLIRLLGRRARRRRDSRPAVHSLGSPVAAAGPAG